MLPRHRTDVFRKMSLMEKWKASWNGEEIDPAITKASDSLGTFYFWFICVTELYVIVCCVIPHNYKDWSPMGQYYLKVLAYFFFIQTVANWLCLRCYDTAFRLTRDRPDLTKNLWESHPEDQGPQGRVSPPCLQEGQILVDMNGVSKPQGQLTWRYCKQCQMHAPPRSHHCKICKVCILKRDHHCYMSGVCVGYWNQRYFIIMNFYIVISSSWGLWEIVHYMRDNFTTDSNWDLFLPYTIYRWLLGSIPMHILFMMFHCYTLWWTGFTALGFTCFQAAGTVFGLTTHEMRNNLPVRCVGSYSENIREVFGVCWPVNFFMPGQLLFRQTGDGKEWPTLKVDRRREALLRLKREREQKTKS